MAGRTWTSIGRSRPGCGWSQDGADILDIGGESTRPGAESVGADEELRRVLPVVERLAARTAALLSIDTYKAVVGREAVARGAAIINDISGLLYDPALATVAAETGAALILMHTRGRSHEMYELAVYDDVVAEVGRGARGRDRTAATVGGGLARGRSSWIPGSASRSEPAHSYSLLARLPELAALGLPLLSGPSRKSFLKEAAWRAAASRARVGHRGGGGRLGPLRRAHRSRPQRRRHDRRGPGADRPRAPVSAPARGRRVDGRTQGVDILLIRRRRR